MISLVTWILSALILLAGIAYLAGKPHTTLRYILKPGTMLLIIALALWRFDPADQYGRFILLGLALSLAGDIFLMLPSDQFLPGLASFLCAHLLYIVAFGPVIWQGMDLLVIGALAVVGMLLFKRFFGGIMRLGGRPMLGAVALYILVICAMVWRAAVSGHAVAAAGALLFLVSDALLGWNRFAQPLPWVDLGVMSTYFTAQYLLAISVAP